MLEKTKLYPDWIAGLIFSQVGLASWALLQTSAVHTASSGMSPVMDRRIAVGISSAASGVDNVMDAECTALEKVTLTGAAAALPSVASMVIVWSPLRIVWKLAGSTAWNCCVSPSAGAKVRCTTLSSFSVTVTASPSASETE